MKIDPQAFIFVNTIKEVNGGYLSNTIKEKY